MSAAVVELVRCLHQAEVPLLHEVEKVQILMKVSLGDRDNKPQIGLDDFLTQVLLASLQALVDFKSPPQRIGIALRLAALFASSASCKRRISLRNCLMEHPLCRPAAFDDFGWSLADASFPC